MERLSRKIENIKLQAQLLDYLISELYPVPTCDDCEYNFTRFSSGKCFKCDGENCFRLADGIQADLRKIVRGIVKITHEHQPLTDTTN